MRVFLAGATGAMGRVLVPGLIAAGHEVVGTTRSRDRLGALMDAGAEPILMDALDARAVQAAVLGARPDVVIHQLTAIRSLSNLRKFDAVFAQTNKLRTEGTDNLLAAALAAGAKRFIAQSFTGWPNARTGTTPKTERDPLDAAPSRSVVQSLAAIKHVESVVPSTRGLDGLVLRYGGFYGPDNSLGRGGEMFELVAKRKFPLVGNGAGVFSFVHITDAARATVAAVDHGGPGIYNIVDDEPAPAAQWLPYLAELIGAKPPMRVPTWLGRIAAGEFAVQLMTQQRGSSNAKAKRELGWQPLYTSWRQGFEDL